MERIIQKINIILGITAHNRQLGFWGKFELLVLWKFRGELITFGQQTQPAFMRQTLTLLSNTIRRIRKSDTRWEMFRPEPVYVQTS
jgi:hypothetical protein